MEFLAMSKEMVVNFERNVKAFTDTLKAVS
jgi:hypothetical protein